MNPLLNNFYKIIESLNEIKLNDKFIIVGSWAYYIYQNYLFKEEILPEALKTTDIDIYILRDKKISEKIDLINLLEAKGYKWVKHIKTEVDKFEKTDFSIEFLTELRGAGAEKKGFAVKNLGIRANSIRYLNLLNEGLIEIEIKNKLKVRLPDPLNYGLHKLLIAQSRRENLTTGINKKGKDINQGVGIISKLDIKKVIEKYNTLPKKWKRKIINSLKQSGNELLVYRFQNKKEE